MIDVIFEINGVEQATPKNARELKLITKWGAGNTVEDKSEAEVSTNSLQFVLEDAETILKHVSDGLKGGVGIFEGIPYAIKLREHQTQLVTQILDGYIDLVDGAKFTSCDEVEATIKKKQALDWLTNQSDSFSFAYLFNQKFVTQSDYVQIPYVLNQRPETFALVMLSLSIYMSTQALIQSVKDISKSTAKFLESINAGLAFGVGDLISAGLNLLFDLVYAIALTYALIKMTEELIDQLFPPVRRYYGMKIKRMFEVGCAYMGLTFQSSIFNNPLWSNLTYLPSKSERGKIGGGANGLGHPNQNSSVYNFGDFLRTMKQMFNASIKLDNNVLIFERADYWDSTAAWTLPDVETNQDIRLSEYSYNTDEMLSNFMISFQTDIQDENTLENFLGTNFQVITTAASINTRPFVNVKNLGEVRLPFALASRKNDLTVVEKALKEMAQSVDKAINQLGGNSSLASKITKRIGMMVLTADTISTDKLMRIDNEVIPAGFKLQASDLWDFHKINSFVPILDSKTGQNIHNQYKVYTGVTIPFCSEDWQLLTKNNKFIAPDGSIGEISDIEWDVYNEKATINYKIPYLYTNNLKLSYNEGE